MATMKYIGLAQDVAQEDTILIGGSPAAADTISVTCADKTATLTGGSSMDTTTEYATGLAELINASRHDANAFTGDFTANVGGQELAEFRDFEATVSGSTVTVKSKTPGVDFTISVAKTGSLTVTHNAEVVAPTGKQYFDNADNFEGGVLPSATDVIELDKESPAISRGLNNTTLDLAIDVLPGYQGSGIGLDAVNTGNGTAYPEYRTNRYLKLPATASTGSQEHRINSASGKYRLDLGTNTPLDVRLEVLNAAAREAVSGESAVQIVGGQALQLIAHAGSVSIGEDSGESATGMEQVITYGPASVTVGTNATFDNVADTVRLNGGRLEIYPHISGASNEIRVYSSTLVIEPDSQFNDLFQYGGLVDFRGDDITTLHGYGGTFDASKCRLLITTNNPVRLFSGYTFIDPNNRIIEEFEFIGCSFETVKIVRGPNYKITYGAVSAITVQ